MATPSNALLNELQTILAADVGSLAAATALKVHLAQAAFTPSPSLALGTLTEATFTGYSSLLATTGTQQTFNDPTSGNRIIQLKEPAGGWHWQATAGTGLPQTMFGWYLTDNGVSILWGSALFNPTVTLVNSGDGVDIGQVRFGLVPSALV
jgi:hypothetical protein